MIANIINKNVELYLRNGLLIIGYITEEDKKFVKLVEHNPEGISGDVYILRKNLIEVIKIKEDVPIENNMPTPMRDKTINKYPTEFSMESNSPYADQIELLKVRK